MLVFRVRPTPGPSNRTRWCLKLATSRDLEATLNCSEAAGWTGLHPIHQCPESRVHLGRRHVHAVTMSGEEPLESILCKSPK